MDDGERMAARDLLIAVTARSTGDGLVVADGDVQTQQLTDLPDVTNPRGEDRTTDCARSRDVGDGSLETGGSPES